MRKIKTFKKLYYSRYLESVVAKFSSLPIWPLIEIYTHITHAALIWM